MKKHGKEKHVPFDQLHPNEQAANIKKWSQEVKTFEEQINILEMILKNRGEKP